MTAVNYLWDPVEQNIVRELDDSGNVIAQYTTEPGLYGDLLSQRRNGEDSYYHYDGQGSTVALTNSAGVVTDTYEYSAFGEVTEHTGSTVNPFQYIGQMGYYRDGETGEYEVRRRPYSAQMERWLATDILESRNLYRYANNSPTIFLDPSGRKCIVCKWGGPYFDGSPLEYDKDLMTKSHFDGINARLLHIAAYIQMLFGSTVNPGSITESYGPWIIDLRKLKKGAKDMVVTGGCHAIRIYVCGDSCKVTVVEENRGYLWNHDDQIWRPIFKPGTVEPAIQIENVVPPDGTYLTLSELKNAKANQCNSVIVLTDCAAIDQKLFREAYQRKVIKQTIIVTGGEVDETATFEHEFRVGMKMPLGAEYETDYGPTGDLITKAKTTTMGDPKDCC